MVENVEMCIECGHCVAACGAGAVEHTLFPRERIHKSDFGLLPSAEQLMMLIRQRRTNRAFTEKPVPKEHLDMILEAAHRAPTASNLQNVGFTLITERKKIEQINRFVIDTLESTAKTLDNPLLKPLLKRIMPGAYRYVPLFKRMKEEYEKGNDLLLRGARILLFIHTPKSSRFGDADANLAYQNGSLMAEALGISQLYTGFVCTAIGRRKGELEKLLGIPSDRVIKAGMGLGIPEFRYPNYIDRYGRSGEIR